MSSRKVFKELLRTVDKYVTKVSNNNIWRNFIIQEFRREEDPETPSSTRNATAPENPSKMSLEFLLNAAQDYTYLVKCIHENKVRMQVILLNHLIYNKK